MFQVKSFEYGISKQRLSLSHFAGIVEVSYEQTSEGSLSLVAHPTDAINVAPSEADKLNDSHGSTGSPSPTITHTDVEHIVESVIYNA